MQIFIKLATGDYTRLRSHIPLHSAAHEAIEKATRIEHSLDGLLFAGYSIPCDAEQARTILETARRSCPDMISKIEQAILRSHQG
jgi:hypothetical protein